MTISGKEESKVIRAENESFELVILDDVPVLFTNARIDRRSIPANNFCYDVRHDDDCCGIACEVKPFVLVNHWGTIISKQELPLENGSYYPKGDLNYAGINMTLGEYVNLRTEDLSRMVNEPSIEMQVNM